MKAAYFLSDHAHIGRPFDDAIIQALVGTGFKEIHIFAPGIAVGSHYHPDVKIHRIEYRSRWLKRMIVKKMWRQYSLFLGACNLPMAFAGLIAIRARRPIVTVCDEIYTGRISPATKYWELIAKFAMRRSRITVITDFVRCDLQRSYAGLRNDHKFVENPSCYSSDYSGPCKSEIRQRLKIPSEAFVVSLVGSIHDHSGVPELAELMGKRVPDIYFLVQSAGTAGASIDALLSLCQDTFPILYLPKRVSFLDALEITNAADIGLVVYRQNAPQFQKMGVSSSKLCCHLLLGQPVIALRQPSFQFIEAYNCGILFDSVDEVTEALKGVRANYFMYSQNALKCTREYLRPTKRVQALARCFRELMMR